MPRSSQLIAASTTFILLFSLLAASPAGAAWPVDGLQLFGPTGKGTQAIAVPDGVGGWFVACADNQVNASSNDVRMQRVSSNGEIYSGWPIEGLVVSGGPAPEEQPRLARDGFAGVFTAWFDARNGAADIFVKRFFPDGSLAPGWVSGGNPATLAPDVQELPQITSDGIGGAFITWEDYRTYDIDGRSRVFAQHLTSDGQTASGWPTDGLEVCPTGSSEIHLCSDGVGGCFVAWTDSRRLGTVPSGIDAYGLHLLPDGSHSLAWNTSGNLLESNRRVREIIYDGAGGFFLASVALSGSYGSPEQHWISRFDASGAPVGSWPVAGIPLESTFGDRYVFTVCSDSLGGVLATWEEDTAGGADVRATRVLPGGTLAPGWSLGGNLVSDPAVASESPTGIAPDGLGGAFVVWEGVIATHTRGIAQHVTAGGSIAPGWPAGGLPVANSTAQYLPRIAHDGSLGALVVWEEYGPGPYRRGLWAQRLLADGIVATELSLASSAATAEGVTLVWQGAGAGALSARVERRVEAGAWERIGLAQREATDRLSYLDRDVVAGTRYGYRLVYVDEGAERVSAETWIDVPSLAVLALEGLRPNPAVGELRVSFSLASAAAARLELLDLAGRRVIDREVGSLGAGRHLLRLDAGERVAPGVYWLRLRQGDRQILARAVVMR